MPKLQYKHTKGALHIGGGRFFFANEPVEVSEEERNELLQAYGEDLEEVTTPSFEGVKLDKLTKTSIKKMNADQQKKLIFSLGGNPDEPTNEEERIAFILKLQDKEE